MRPPRRRVPDENTAVVAPIGTPCDAATIGGRKELVKRPTSTIDDRAVRRRPTERRQQIIREAAQLFAEHGFGNVTMAQIAAAVGITAGALYRHFAGKTELLASVLMTWFDNISPVRDRDAALEQILTRRAENAVSMPSLGVLWSRESRHLPTADRAELLARIREHHAVYQSALQRERAMLAEDDASMMAWAIQSVLSSPTTRLRGIDHDQYVELLRRAALNLSYLPLPPNPAGPPPTSSTIMPASRRESLLLIAEQLFAERGFDNTTLAQIGFAGGATGPSLYTHFDSKSSILDEILTRGGSVLWVELSEALREAEAVEDALQKVVRAYVRRANLRPTLITIIVTENDRLKPEQRRSQHAYLEEWVALLTQSQDRPDTAQAHALVRAALRTINDLARTPGVVRQPAFVDRVTTTAMSILRTAAR